MDLPHINMFGRYLNHFSHAFGPGIEFRMPQEAAYEKCRLVFPNIEVNQAIVRVAKASIKEISIMTKESSLARMMQETYNFRVCHSLPTDFGANLSYSNSPPL